MGRRWSMRPIRVRSFRKGEVKKLRRMTSKGSEPRWVRWAQVVLARGLHGEKPARCAELFGCSIDTVARAVERWNKEGMKMFRKAPLPGRPRTFTEAERSRILALAKEPPSAAGKPWNQWSLHKLKDAATGMKIVARVSHETIRQWLLEAGITPQRMKTWKHSNDPEYAVKKNG
jgi:transposase